MAMILRHYGLTERMILRLTIILLGRLIVDSYAVEDKVRKLACNSSIEYVSRAVGANFSVTIISPCRNDALGCRIQYSIQEDGIPKEYIAERFTVQKDGNGGSIIQTYQEIGATISYSYHKASDDNEIILNLLIVPENRSVVMNIYVHSHMPCAVQFFQIGTVSFIGCQQDTDHIVVDPSVDIVRYSDVGNIVCDEYGKGRAIFTNGSEALQTYCDADATWKDVDNITCLYPILTNIAINRDQYNESVLIRYNHSAENQEVNLTCNSNNDFQIGILSSPRFKLGNVEINKTLLITPNLNGKRILCYFENDFTKRFVVNSTYFTSSVLMIEFGPLPPPEYNDLCVFPNGTIPFYSNPLSSKSTLSLVINDNITAGGSQDQKIKAEIESCCGNNYGVREQRITPTNTTLNISNSSIYLRYYDSENYSYYAVVPCSSTGVTNMTTEGTGTTVKTSSTDTETTTGKESAISASIIAAIVVATSSVLLLVVLTVLIVLCKRKRGEKRNSYSVDDLHTSDRSRDFTANAPAIPMHRVIDQRTEEQTQHYSGYDNMEQNDELYSAVDQQPNHKDGHGSNPPDTQNAATYAEVNKGNKKSNNISNSDQPNTSDSITYAVVNKKDKENMNGSTSRPQDGDEEPAMYAQVNMNKKKKNKGDPKSDQPNATDATTYAAVDRTKKKNRQKANGSKTQGVVENHATYAEVKKKKKGKDLKGSETHSKPGSGEIYAEVGKKNKKCSDEKKSEQATTIADATYAAVNRGKKKNKKGSQPNADANTTYAEVNKKNKKR